MVEQQSQDLNAQKRLLMRATLQRKVRGGRGRPSSTGGSTTSRFWPHVKGLVPHDNIYNFGRMADVWRDK